LNLRNPCNLRINSHCGIQVHWKTMKFALHLALGLLACAAGTGCRPRPAPPAVDVGTPLAEQLESARARLGCPGAAVGVYRGGETLLERGFGVADVATGRAVAADTVFRVGSLAKPMVAVVLLQLAEEGRLSLDDPVGRHVAGVPDGDAITLRMLGDHTSGLCNYIAIPAVKERFAREPERAWTAAELKALSFAQKPHFRPPGAGWMYSNVNTVLLGEVIERAEGRPLAETLHARIFAPLGLTRTAFRLDAALPEDAARGYNFGPAAGPVYWKGAGDRLHDVTADSPSKWGAAGAVYSTVPDIRRFADALFGGRLVSPASLAAMRQWRDTGYPVDFSYGLGLARYLGAEGHRGQVPGYQSIFAHDPALGLTVIVLANLYSSPRWEEPAEYLFFTVMEQQTGRSYFPRL
jgi:D-alanyl-D-alanine carboxypeptidase